MGSDSVTDYLPVYFALSSCLGDGLRSTRPSFGRTYFNSGAGTSGGAWESVEMYGLRREDEDLESEEGDWDGEAEGQEYEGVFHQSH